MKVISMATADDATKVAEIKIIAIELFKVRSGLPGASAQQLATGCVRDAMIFVHTFNEAITGGDRLLAEDSDPLDTAFAPNLSKTHPINLMSRARGNLQKVQLALADLEANPAAEFYETYNWGKPEINQARALFPAVILRSKRTTTAK
jgi:hypothetical protein